MLFSGSKTKYQSMLIKAMRQHWGGRVWIRGAVGTAVRLGGREPCAIVVVHWVRVTVGSALQRAQNTMGWEKCGALAERHWMGKNWCQVYCSMSASGGREEGGRKRRRKRSLFFHFSWCWIYALVKTDSTVSACILYPDHKRVSQAVLVGRQWFGQHFLLRKAFDCWVTISFCESFCVIVATIILIGI